MPCSSVGRAGGTLGHIEEVFEKRGICWCCALNGKNEIVESPDNGDAALGMIEIIENQTDNPGEAIDNQDASENGPIQGDRIHRETSAPSRNDRKAEKTSREQAERR